VTLYGGMLNVMQHDLPPPPLGGADLSQPVDDGNAGRWRRFFSKRRTRGGVGRA